MAQQSLVSKKEHVVCLSIITSRHCIKQNGMNSTVVYLSLYFINLLTTFLTKNAGSLVSISVSKMLGSQPEKLDRLQQVEVLWQIFRAQSMHDQTWFFSVAQLFFSTFPSFQTLLLVKLLVRLHKKQQK